MQKADRKWRCKQIYSYFEGLYCIFSKNLRKFSGNINFRKFSGNFRKDCNKFPKISGNFPREISGLTTLDRIGQLEYMAIFALHEYDNSAYCVLWQPERQIAYLNVSWTAKLLNLTLILTTAVINSLNVKLSVYRNNNYKVASNQIHQPLGLYTPCPEKREPIVFWA